MISTKNSYGDMVIIYERTMRLLSVYKDIELSEKQAVVFTNETVWRMQSVIVYMRLGRITPQAIFSPASPAGCVLKSSGIRWITTDRFRISEICTCAS